MTPQEHDQLTQFLKQLGEARLSGKDDEADKLIRQTVEKQPNAPYLLVQRAILVEQALNVAKAQIAELQAQLRNEQAGCRNSGFLGGGNPWAQSFDSGRNSGGVPGAGNYQVPRSVPGSYAAPPATASQSSLPGGGTGSFLGSIATTAAGVVAGGFLFQGLESLLGHHGSPSSEWGEPSSEHLSEQTIINNYYDTPPDGELARNDDWSQPDDTSSFFGDDEGQDADTDDGSSWV